jgi:hypothetical protein
MSGYELNGTARGTCADRKWWTGTRCTRRQCAIFGALINVVFAIFAIFVRIWNLAKFAIWSGKKATGIGQTFLWEEHSKSESRNYHIWTTRPYTPRRA